MNSHEFVQLSGIASKIRSVKPAVDVKDYVLDTLSQAVSMKGRFDVFYSADGRQYSVIHEEFNTTKLNEGIKLDKARYNGWYDLRLLLEQWIRLCDGKRSFGEKVSEIVRKSGSFE
mmetsp:Transcript_13853/g.24844  ORF Transcript_13853/g.24844 Transcript_13853/m.24844 type:complete len:116 (+) Transcript_13853:932-1279(+)